MPGRILSEWKSGTTRRIAVAWNGIGMATGVYMYTLQVSGWYGGVSYGAAPVTGTLVVVNRSARRFVGVEIIP